MQRACANRPFFDAIAREVSFKEWRGTIDPYKRRSP